MLRILLLIILCIVIARLFWRIVGAFIDGARGVQGPTSAVKLVRDPVCGTFVDPHTALSASASGSAYYFCSEDCRRKFTVGGRQ